MLLCRLSAATLIVALSCGSAACTLGPEAKDNEVLAVSQSAVHARFDLTSLDTAPFPSNAFTVSDPSHLTGRRVNLPYPDCSDRRSDCEDILHLNELDGFNLLPRLSIPFDGDIDPASVSSSNVFLLALGDAAAKLDRGRDSRPRPPRVVGINQVVWDPTTTTLHVESDQVLDQHASYALVVTRGIQSRTGKSVEASAAFLNLRQTVPGAYHRELLNALSIARSMAIVERDVVVASVFTTQSVTAVLEKVRDQLRSLESPSVISMSEGRKTWRGRCSLRPPRYIRTARSWSSGARSSTIGHACEPR